MPGDAWIAEALQRARAERERIEPLLRPIWDRARQTLTGLDRHRAYMPPTETDERAADRLRVAPVQLKAASRALWARDFEEERDARVGAVAAVSPQRLQALRGHATRAILAELRDFLAACGIGNVTPSARKESSSE